MRQALLCLSLLSGCGGVDRGSPKALGQVHYRVLEYELSSGWAGSCLPNFRGADYSAYENLFRDLKWAIGAQIDVVADWPDRADCYASQGQRVCPDVDANFVAVGGRVWDSVYVTPKPARSFQVGLMANNEGEGGFKTILRDQELDPPFKQPVVSPTAIQFQQSPSPYYADLIPRSITEIHVARGAEVIVTAALRDPSGAKVCGALPATATIDPPGLFAVLYIQGPNVNLPYRIIAGNSAGRGTFAVHSGNLRAALTVIVD